MKSNVFNRANEQVEQLVPNGNQKLFYIILGGTTPFNLNYTGGSFVLDLRKNAVYEIEKITVIIYFFEDMVNDTYAYPNAEQFNAGVDIDAYLTDASNNIQKTLFTDLACNLSNAGPQKLLEVPFTFRTDNTGGQRLLLNTKGTRSFFTNLTGIVIPPVGAPNEPIVIYGQVYLEGVSYSLIPSQEAAKVEAAEDIDNVAEMDLDLA